MKCEALGDQPLAVTWRRDENVISKSGDDRFENLLFLAKIEITVVYNINI